MSFMSEFDIRVQDAVGFGLCTYEEIKELPFEELYELICKREKIFFTALELGICTVETGLGEYTLEEVEELIKDHEK